MSKYRMYAAILTPLLKTPLGIQMLQSTCRLMVQVQLGTLVTGQVQQVQMDYRQSGAETLWNYTEITARTRN
jgi:hypothetical protein